MGRSTKNELLSDFMSSEMGVYENIYDYMTYSEDVRNRLCNHIESQICAINSVALERLLHGVEAIIAGLKSKNHNTDDLERFIPMIQAAMRVQELRKKPNGCGGRLFRHAGRPNGFKKRPIGCGRRLNNLLKRRLNNLLKRRLRSL